MQKMLLSDSLLKFMVLTFHSHLWILLGDRREGQKWNKGTRVPSVSSGEAKTAQDDSKSSYKDHQKQK